MPRLHDRLARAALCFAVAALAGPACSSDNPVAEPLALDADAFRCQVEPVLMARCGFYACHGSESRPFRVYAPNRLRIDPDVPRLGAPLTEQERAANLDAALLFAGGASGSDAQLAAKPLDVDNGGQFHRGKTQYLSRDVFTDTGDLGYQRVTAWLDGATADPNCVPEREVGP